MAERNLEYTRNHKVILALHSPDCYWNTPINLGPTNWRDFYNKVDETQRIQKIKRLEIEKCKNRKQVEFLSHVSNFSKCIPSLHPLSEAFSRCASPKWRDESRQEKTDSRYQREFPGDRATAWVASMHLVQEFILLTDAGYKVQGRLLKKVDMKEFLTCLNTFKKKSSTSWWKVWGSICDSTQNIWQNTQKPT